VLFFVIDRCDSVLGVLIVASLLVPVQALTWVWVLVLGPLLHALFSVLLHRLGVKARAL
jgi:CDP-2,3-bis-(O-geranylgeranyl)-sn-glycerol synthase